MAKKVLRILAGLFLFGITATLLLNLSWWLTGFAMLALVLVGLWKYRKQSKKKNPLERRNLRPIYAGAGVLIVVGLWASGHYGVLPSESRTSSCDGSLTGKLDHVAPPPPVKKTADAELEAARVDLARDAASQLHEAERAVDVDLMWAPIRRIQSVPSAPGLEAPRKALDESWGKVESYLRENHLAQMDGRAAMYRDFEKRVNEIVEKSKTATQAEIGPLSRQLSGIGLDSQLTTIRTDMYAVEESLLALTRQSIDVKPAYFIEWGEDQGRDSKRVTYREEITITSLQDAPLVEIDASQLQREAQSGNTEFAMFLAKNGGGREAVADPAHILIPKQRNAVLIYERYAPLEIAPYCRNAPLSSIERVRFAWPSSAASVSLGATMVSNDLQLPVWFALDRTKTDAQYVSAIRLPKYSFFASGREFEFRTEDGADLLTPKDPRSAARQDIGDEGNWVEVTQDRWVLRQSLVSRARSFLVFDNALAAIAVFVLHLGVSAISLP